MNLRFTCCILSSALAAQLMLADLDGDAFLHWAAEQTVRVKKFLSWCEGHKNIKVSANSALVALSPLS
jgi:hypothetical protein